MFLSYNFERSYQGLEGEAIIYRRQGQVLYVTME